VKDICIPHQEKWESYYLLKKPELEAKWDLASVFGNPYPICVEIGCGNGHFLSQKCRFQSEANYIGIELNKKRLLKSIQKIYKREPDNIRFIEMDAGHAIQYHFPRESVDQYYYNFPDPWPKKRHFKRRLFTRDFLKDMVVTLKPKGKLTIVTDHKDYLEWMLKILQNQRWLINVFDTEYVLEYPGHYFISLYEEKWRLEGRPIYYVEYKKEETIE